MGEAEKSYGVVRQITDIRTGKSNWIRLDGFSKGAHACNTFPANHQDKHPYTAFSS
jgi:hypothetical protein